ncbi:cation transporter [Rhodococcus sp. D2-41]|uniref:Cation diffusion facilitator family transporter n=1 Tax=Speluncibacter jeojiensis TaxID=2710754 RepID=A0A9X4REB8_9ACTN|nr:cation diffusion facilitator family transporter [Rhodococcus sp. D2-41]MDG3010088.1 cation transporter [Rhodococcus sp. D2-41]MDG3015634.1 cation diffusion facilitator family transporter [Corynebacteriales bacterium D3-21]
MGAGHGHAHGHSHGVAPGDTNVSSARIRRMVVALVALLVFLGLEIGVALSVDSLALLADAGHMLTDVLGLSMGLVALHLARRGSRAASRTFGWHRAEVLTAIANAMLLLAVAGWILFEAIDRIGRPPSVPGLPLIVVAVAGLAVNVFVMLMLRGDSKDSLAVRGAYMEVLADAVGNVGVLIAGAVTVLTGWGYADIIVGVAISIWVVPRAMSLAMAALRILTQASPSDIDVRAVEQELRAVEGVADVHDLHVWTLTTGMDVATAHISSDADPARVLRGAQAVLSAHGLEHSTIQVEPCSTRADCAETITW